MLVQQILDLLGRDVLTLADDDVLEPTGEHHVAGRVEMADVAGAEPTLVVERVGVERWVGVTLEHHRALQADLAVLTGRAHHTLGGDHPDGDARDRRAVGVHELLVGVVRTALGDHRTLGHAIAVTHRDPHLGEHLGEHLRWLRGAATGEQTQRRDDRLTGLRALLGEIHLVERRTATGHGGAFAAEEFDGGVELEGLDDDGATASVEQHHEVVGPGDVRIGEGDGPDVGQVELDRVGQAEAAGHERVIGVLDTLRRRGRARGVVDPTNLVAVSGDGRKRRRVAGGEVVVGHEHRRRDAALGSDPIGHRHEIESVPVAGHAQELRPGLLHHESDLAIAIDRNDGVLDRSESGEGQGERNGLDASRQLPGDPGASPHAEVVKARRRPLGEITKRPEGDLPVFLVIEHDQVGRGRGPGFDELPHGGRLHHDVT